jgi:hypothetical protein
MEHRTSRSYRIRSHYDTTLCRLRHQALSLLLRQQNGPQMKLLHKPIFQTSPSDFQRKNGCIGQTRLVRDLAPKGPFFG